MTLTIYCYIDKIIDVDADWGTYSYISEFYVLCISMYTNIHIHTKLSRKLKVHIFVKKHISITVISSLDTKKKKKCHDQRNNTLQKNYLMSVPFN